MRTARAALAVAWLVAGLFVPIGATAASGGLEIAAPRCHKTALDATFTLYATQPAHHPGRGTVHGSATYRAYDAGCAPLAGFVDLELQAYFGYPYFGWVNISGPKPLNLGGWSQGERHTVRFTAKCPARNRRWRIKAHYTAGTDYQGLPTRPYNTYHPRRRGRLLRCA